MYVVSGINYKMEISNENVKYISDSIQCAMINALTLILDGDKYDKIAIYKLENNDKFEMNGLTCYDVNTTGFNCSICDVFNADGYDAKCIEDYINAIVTMKDLTDIENVNKLIYYLIDEWWKCMPIIIPSNYETDMPIKYIANTSKNDENFFSINNVINCNTLGDNELSVLAIFPSNVKLDSILDAYQYSHAIRDNSSIISSSNISGIATAIEEIENRKNLPKIIRDNVVNALNRILDIIKEKIKEISDETHK